ncbi:MAG: PucR family transcriptional regulator [Phycicoccus sp.]|nr:PucR family transcriptional regulator [Phycicoccus sp.]NMM35004.1 PucR family transcriptional regulator [Phycicoccus sp.]
MVNVAKNSPPPRHDLPATDTDTVSVLGLSLRAVLELGCLRGATVVAGHGGLDRIVSRLNVMEVPDILPWVRPNELLLTTGYPLRSVPDTLPALVQELADRGLAGIGVKLGRYLDELPAAMLAEADRVGLPIIALPDGVGFDDVINQVLTAVLNRQAAVLARADEVHRALVDIVLTGGGLDMLCAELAPILPGVAMVTSTDGRVLSSDGPAGEVVAAMALDCFDASGRFLVESEPVGIRSAGTGSGGTKSSADVRARRAVVPIVAGALDHGRLVAFSADRELTGDDVHILERAATVAALAITKAQAVSAVESKYQADFLRDALAGRAGLSEHVVAHAHSLGWDFGRPMVVVVAEADPTAMAAELAPEELRLLQERFGAAWTRVVRQRDGSAPVVGFSHEVVAVLGVPTDADAESITRTVRDLVRQVSGDGGGGRRSFSTGISRPISSPDALPGAYEQARKAVSVGRQMSGPSALTHFDGLGIFRLLTLVPDTAELRSFATEALGELITNDTAENADLRRTLSVLLDTNLNVAETARILHFHYNTLRYRIVKLERMLGPFTTDPNLRLTLSIALLVVQMRGI